MRRKYKIIYLILLAAVLTTGGCRKIELPPPVSEDPVFSLDLGWAGGTGLNLSAGANRYYLYTGYESDSLNVFEFSGRFAQQDCLDQCAPSFAIYLRDAQVTPGNTPDFPGFLQAQQSYFFRHPVVPEYDTLILQKVNFTSTSQTAGAQPTLIWTFDDSLTIVGQAPEVIRNDMQPFKACLEFNGTPGGCYAKQCQTIQFNAFFPFSATIESDSNGFWLTAVPLGGIAPFSYSWNNGITTQTNQAVQPGSIYCVTITDATGMESTSCVQPAFNPVGTPLCVASFTYATAQEIELTPIPGDSLQFKTVILEYVEDGVTYRSDRLEQPPGAFFTIDSVEPYEPNENNQPTLRIEARFRGVLASESGAIRQVEEATVVFGVAY